MFDMGLDPFDGDGKTADMIRLSCRRDAGCCCGRWFYKVRHGDIRLTGGLFDLLTKTFKTDIASRGVDDNGVLSVRVGRPEANYSAGSEPFFFDDLTKQVLRIIVQFLRYLPHFLIFQDLGEFP